jgi:hypothetical protein
MFIIVHKYGKKELHYNCQQSRPVIGQNEYELCHFCISHVRLCFIGEIAQQSLVA